MPNQEQPQIFDQENPQHQVEASAALIRAEQTGHAEFMLPTVKDELPASITEQHDPSAIEKFKKRAAILGATALMVGSLGFAGRSDMKDAQKMNQPPAAGQTHDR